MRLFVVGPFALLVALVVSGCGKNPSSEGGASPSQAASQSEPERLCRNAVQASLLNPETLQFRDFEPISAADFTDHLLARSIEASGVPIDEIPDEQISAARERFAQAVQEVEGDAYSVRVRAETQVGNTVTEIQICIVNEGNCECQELDGN